MSEHANRAVRAPVRRESGVGPKALEGFVTGLRGEGPVVQRPPPQRRRAQSLDYGAKIQPAVSDSISGGSTSSSSCVPPQMHATSREDRSFDPSIVALRRSSYSNARRRLSVEPILEGAARGRQVLEAMLKGTLEACSASPVLDTWIGQVKRHLFEEELEPVEEESSDDEQSDTEVGVEEEAVQTLTCLFDDLEALGESNVDLEAKVKSIVGSLKEVEKSFSQLLRLARLELDGFTEVQDRINDTLHGTHLMFLRFEEHVTDARDFLREMAPRYGEAMEEERIRSLSITDSFQDGEGSFGHCLSINSTGTTASRRSTRSRRSRFKFKRHCSACSLVLKPEFAEKPSLEWLERDICTRPIDILHKMCHKYLPVIVALGRPTPEFMPIIERMQQSVPPEKPSSAKSVTSEDDEEDEVYVLAGADGDEGRPRRPSTAPFAPIQEEESENEDGGEFRPSASKDRHQVAPCASQSTGVDSCESSYPVTDISIGEKCELGGTNELSVVGRKVGEVGPCDNEDSTLGQTNTPSSSSSPMRSELEIKAGIRDKFTNANSRSVPRIKAMPRSAELVIARPEVKDSSSSQSMDALTLNPEMPLESCNGCAEKDSSTCAVELEPSVDSFHDLSNSRTFSKPLLDRQGTRSDGDSTLEAPNKNTILDNDFQSTSHERLDAFDLRRAKNSNCISSGGPDLFIGKNADATSESTLRNTKRSTGKMRAMPLSFDTEFYKLQDTAQVDENLVIDGHTVNGIHHTTIGADDHTRNGQKNVDFEALKAEHPSSNSQKIQKPRRHKSDQKISHSTIHSCESIADASKTLPSPPSMHGIQDVEQPSLSLSPGSKLRVEGHKSSRNHCAGGFDARRDPHAEEITSHVCFDLNQEKSHAMGALPAPALGTISSQGLFTYQPLENSAMLEAVDAVTERRATKGRGERRGLPAPLSKTHGTFWNEVHNDNQPPLLVKGNRGVSLPRLPGAHASLDDVLPGTIEAVQLERQRLEELSSKPSLATIRSPMLKLPKKPWQTQVRSKPSRPFDGETLLKVGNSRSLPTLRDDGWNNAVPSRTLPKVSATANMQTKSLVTIHHKRGRVISGRPRSNLPFFAKPRAVEALHGHGVPLLA